MLSKRTDANHRQIVGVFRNMGASIIDLSGVGKGCPDLCIGINNVSIFVEIKSSEKATYTIRQKEFMESWKGGPIARIDSVDSAIRLIKLALLKKN